MPIENRELAAETRLVARYKKQDRTCEVVETAGGLRYRLDDGTEHSSPSSAGKAVTGGACNGWVFWSVEGTVNPKREPRAKGDKPAKAPVPKKSPKAKAAKKAGPRAPRSRRRTGRRRTASRTAAACARRRSRR